VRPDPRANLLDPGLAGSDARPVEGVDNGFLAGYRVRFDEAGPDGTARTSALLRYAQDIAWRHSEELGFDRAWYQAKALSWVVRGVELELHVAIPMGHTLRVSTAVVGHRRIWARRMGEARLADGRLAALITTDWVLLDARGRIVRIPEDFGVAFLNPEVKSEILRLRPPDGEPVSTLALSVRPRDLDPLDHVNNAVYVDWLDEAVEAAGWRTPETASGSTWRLEYLASAARGDSVVVQLAGEAAAWSASIRRADGVELVRATCSAAPIGRTSSVSEPSAAHSSKELEPRVPR
jgi:acyl-ACP thioesterase